MVNQLLVESSEICNFYNLFILTELGFHDGDGYLRERIWITLIDSGIARPRPLIIIYSDKFNFCLTFGHNLYYSEEVIHLFESCCRQEAIYCKLRVLETKDVGATYV